jgi:hypothetical protein
MANLDRPRGFEPHGEIKQVVVQEAGSACYPGDMVALASDGQVDPVATGAKVLGLCLSYASASGQKVLVSIDPSQVYAVQADETEVDAQTDIGNCCDITATAGDTTYKTSRQELDSSTIAAASAQLLILSIDTNVKNAAGAQATVLVKINESQLADSFAGI